MLLNLVSNVKARLDGKLDSLTFPMPQFVVVGKQSVGKSRLIEALAGEPFNFVSGTLGSRRPTVLEFRNLPGTDPSRWSVFDDATLTWKVYPVQQVMQLVGLAHENLGHNVSETPIRVKVEGSDCTDLSLVDLPGFRAYAKDKAMQDLNIKIENMVMKFMKDENNTILCVEEAGDAAGFATLGKCKEVDPGYRRTILIRNKLDKYYNDLHHDNINMWLKGYGDLDEKLTRFALSLPHWSGDKPDKPFGVLRQECSDRDMQVLTEKGAAQKFQCTIGFRNYTTFMEFKTQELFAQALSPMLMRLKLLKEDHEDRLAVIKDESETINEDNILHATRSAGITFAQSFNFLMEGALSSETNRFTMEEELREFHKYCDRTGVLDMGARSHEGFPTLDDYIEYLRKTVKVPGMDVQLNGGAQFRRLMYEVEVFVRFAGLAHKLRPGDVIQARGSAASGRDTPWEDVITSLLSQSAPYQIRNKTQYVGQRLKWFFVTQKQTTVDFMAQIKGSPEEHMFSRLIGQKALVIQRNEAMKNCIFNAFDAAVEQHHDRFIQNWADFMKSMFSSPLKMLKTCSMPKIIGSYEDEVAPTLEATKERIVEERESRGSLQRLLRDRIKQIPDEDMKADEAVKMVQSIMEMTFAVIRCVIADQMQLYSESFFLLPMLRRLEGSMSKMELEEEEKERYRARLNVLTTEAKVSTGCVLDLQWCIDEITKFKVTLNKDQ